MNDLDFAQREQNRFEPRHIPDIKTAIIVNEPFGDIRLLRDIAWVDAGKTATRAKNPPHERGPPVVPAIQR